VKNLPFLGLHLLYLKTLLLPPLIEFLDHLLLFYLLFLIFLFHPLGALNLRERGPLGGLESNHGPEELLEIVRGLDLTPIFGAK
jgi:hypothetical protein